MRKIAVATMLIFGVTLNSCAVIFSPVTPNSIGAAQAAPDTD